MTPLEKIAEMRHKMREVLEMIADAYNFVPERKQKLLASQNALLNAIAEEIERQMPVSWNLAKLASVLRGGEGGKDE